MTSKTLKELVKQKEEIEKEFRARGKELVKKEIETFFAEHPELMGVGWTQYAPYFNDGDPCVFHVHEFYATFGKDADGDEIDVADGFSNYEGWEDSGEDDRCRLASKLEGLINDEDLMKIAFGDDCQVIARRTKDGVKIVVDEVSHD